MDFKEVDKEVFLYKDVINVYVIKHKDRAILIDFGSGEILDQLSKLEINQVDYILHTHYHRDQNFGDKKAMELGIKIGAPYKEQKLFNNCLDFWRDRSYYNIYQFKPTFFVSTYNIPLSLTFKNNDIFEWYGYKFKILDTPGHTTGSISYILNRTNQKNKTIAFTGDLIHSGGKAITYYDLEYIYDDNGEGGIKSSLESFDKLLMVKPDLLLPSHGDIIKEPKKDIIHLKQNFKRARYVFHSEYTGIDNIDLYNPESEKGLDLINLNEIFPSIYHEGFKPPYIIKGTHQNCILIDFAGSKFFGYPIEELFKILDNMKVKIIDFVIPTHYHDDHIAGIPFLQKNYNVKVYALENMADVLKNPTHYRIGCLIDQPIKVDRILKEGEKFQWDNWEFQAFHFPGQAEYHMGLFGKIDDKTILFTGDSISSSMLIDRHTNFNCLNLCRIGDHDGYMKCADLLIKLKPQFIAISHYGIVEMNDVLIQKFKDIVSDYKPTISDIVAQANPNMGSDPNWICFKPIRVISELGKTINTSLLVHNYLNKNSTLKFKLNLPKTWSSSIEEGEFIVDASSILEVPISIKIPEKEAPVGRTVITANIRFNNSDLGPFPDLMIDHGYNPPKKWQAWKPEYGSDLLNWIFKKTKKATSFFNNK